MGWCLTSVGIFHTIHDDVKLFCKQQRSEDFARRGKKTERNMMLTERHADVI